MRVMPMRGAAAAPCQCRVRVHDAVSACEVTLRAVRPGGPGHSCVPRSTVKGPVPRRSSTRRCSARASNRSRLPSSSWTSASAMAGGRGTSGASASAMALALVQEDDGSLDLLEARALLQRRVLERLGAGTLTVDLQHA